MWGYFALSVNQQKLKLVFFCLCEIALDMICFYFELSSCIFTNNWNVLNWMKDPVWRLKTRAKSKMLPDHRLCYFYLVLRNLFEHVSVNHNLIIRLFLSERAWLRVKFSLPLLRKRFADGVLLCETAELRTVRILTQESVHLLHSCKLSCHVTVLKVVHQI